MAYEGGRRGDFLHYTRDGRLRTSSLSLPDELVYCRASNISTNNRFSRKLVTRSTQSRPPIWSERLGRSSTVCYVAVRVWRFSSTHQRVEDDLAHSLIGPGASVSSCRIEHRGQLRQLVGELDPLRDLHASLKSMQDVAVRAGVDEGTYVDRRACGISFGHDSYCCRCSRNAAGGETTQTSFSIYVAFDAGGTGETYVLQRSDSLSPVITKEQGSVFQARVTSRPRSDENVCNQPPYTLTLTACPIISDVTNSVGSRVSKRWDSALKDLGPYHIESPIRATWMTP